MKTSDAICNISSTELSQSEISLLNKGLNFCATTNPRQGKWSIGNWGIENGVVGTLT